MARLRPSCLSIRPIMLFALLAIFGLAFAAPPVMAEGAPINNINPDNTVPLDDTPWTEFTDRLAPEEGLGSQYMVMQVAYWFYDIGIIDKGEDTRVQAPGTGNQERNTANGTQDLTNSH